MANLDYAIRYAALGLHIFPCEPNGKDPLEGLMGGFRNATRDEAQLRKWWKAHPTANIGCYPGASGLIVLDVDVKDGGMGEEQLEALESAHSALPDAPVSITPSKGRHLLFSKGCEFVDGVVITNTKLADDIDIRSDNGYILLEPSVTPDGAYSFIDWDVLLDAAPSFPAVPDWVLEVQAKRIVAAGRGDASNLDPISAAPDLSEEVLNRFNSLLAKSTKIRNRYQGGTEGLDDTSGSSMDMSMASILKAVGFSYLETVALLAKWPHGSKSPDRNKDRYWQRIWTHSLVKEVAVVPVVDYETDKDGRIMDMRENLVKALGDPSLNDCRIAFDNFYGSIVVASSGDHEWRLLAETDAFKIAMMLESRDRPIRFRRIKTVDIRAAIQTYAELNPTDTAIDWVNSLVWDGVPRVDTFLSTYLGAEKSEYHQAIGRYMWTALAGRLLVPGHKADMIPILVGKQGTRKSSAVAALSPFASAFTDMSFTHSDADTARMLKGKIVVELGELKGMSKRDSAHIKQFVTRTFEEWTPKFCELPVRYQRRFLMIGTTNADDFLNDETGERRWLPFKSGLCDPASIERDRDQLWAEAVVLFKEHGVIFAEAEKRGTQSHEQFTQGHPWFDPIKTYLMTKTEITTRAILENLLKIEINSPNIKSQEMEVAKILKKLGWEKCWLGSIRGWKKEN
jgi:predicted P-loop ATPase